MFAEDVSHNPNCHLAGHAIFNYSHLPGAELQDRGGGASDLGDNPAFPGSVCVTGSCSHCEDTGEHRWTQCQSHQADFGC